jgi:DNA-directed RNA polymerase specialized sigma24 family protein
MLKPPAPPHQALAAQPVKRAKRGGLAAGLAEFDGEESAQRLARLAGDRELAAHLALHGYEGPEWLEFAETIAAYGLQVMKAWIATGLVFPRCAQRGVKLQPQRFDHDDAQELADETVVRAIQGFKRTVLMKNKWDPKRGASLKTFFVGQCLLRFRDVLERWNHEQCRPPLASDELARQMSDLMPDVATTLQLVELKREINRGAMDSIGAISGVMELGFSAAEIAEVLGTTTSTVENRLYHYRKKAQKS